MNTTARRVAALALLAVAVAATWAAVPAGYYASLNGKSGQALKNAIHELTAKHTVLSYNSLWDYFPSTDCYPNDRGRVWDMYSDKDYRFRGTSPVGGMNKEHSFPKSWWGGTQVDAYTDLNHLYPSDGPANMAKSNWPLGEVQQATFDNGVSRIGTPVTGHGGGAGRALEPDDRYRGDFARTYFYMATCYQDYKWKYTYMVTNSDWRTLNQWSVNMLLKWARQDPVSDKEKDRNDAVYRVQNNRNPFIDNPELIEYIWGDKAGQVFNTDGGGTPGGDPELITPTQGTVLNFGDVAIGRSASMVLYVKGMNLTNSLSLQLYRSDYRMFSIPVSSVDRSSAMTADGYPLTVTYTPTAIGQHKAKLLLSDGGLVGSVGVELEARCLPVPSLSSVTALPAQEVTDSSFVATWTASPDTIDFYVVTRTIYDQSGHVVSRDEVNTDETSYRFNDRQPGQTHTYSVKASRLGYTSAESNVVTVDASGVSGVEADRPVAFIATEGGVIVKCGEPLAGVRIYSPSGALVKGFEQLCSDDRIALPMGVYVFTAANSTRPVKLIVR